MRPIIIVKCYSSAVNYIHDIRALGYEPVLLEPYIADEALRAEIREDYDRDYRLNGDVRPRVITEKASYGETLEMIRALDPLLILPGCDNGIYLSLRLSNDLGLKSNAFADYAGMRKKYQMQMALRDAGLNYMPTDILHAESEAVSFFHHQGGRAVVLKISEGSGTAGVRICDTEAEVTSAYRGLEELRRSRGRDGEVLIGQRYAEGPEYAVDTISCAGRHVALYGWRYSKHTLPDYATIYDRTVYFSPDEPAYTELIDYVFRVLTALRIQYGPVHTEVIQTADGPVLVEVNCRPGGGSQKYTFQDKVMQEHETMVALHSYLLEPEEFFRRYLVKMHLKQPAAQKDIILRREMYVKKATISEACGNLPTFAYALHHGEHRLYPKTTDLSSTGGTVYLTGPDETQIGKDLDYINWLESEHPERLFQVRESSEGR